MKRRDLLALPLLALPAAGRALPSRVPPWQEWHHRVRAPADGSSPPVVLTLDACGGACDHVLLEWLVAQRLPATLFITRRWIDRHPAALRSLVARPDLFDLQNHGTHHVLAIVAAQGRLYGLPLQPDVAHLRDEVQGAADRIRALTGRSSTWFRGAGAAYDDTGVRTVEALGHRIAGFSINADAGATLPAAAVAARLRAVRPGDVVLAHMNHPHSGTAAGFAAALPGWRARGLRFARLSEVELERVP